MRHAGFVLAIVLIAGCQSRNAPAPARAGATSAVTAAELGKIGFAFAGYEDSLKKGPASAADLQPFLRDGAVEREAHRKLSDGTIVFIWKATSKTMPAGPAMTVLAYGRDVPASGGLVLFGSGEVRTLTAADFARATKATAAP
jgi:hypothetical protein